MTVILPLSVGHHLLTLPELTIWFQGNGITVYDAFLDTGSGDTLLDADIAAQVGINFTTGLTIRTIHGIGAPENVFEQEVILEVGGLQMDAFVIEVGNMQRYGFDALIGLDFLLTTRATIDLEAMTLTLRD